jgi:beta-phosphoglucomutase-like phosphatase (HAD superfamily)
MIDAILFDLDGTLIDTESVAMTAGKAAFLAMGHDVKDVFLHGLVGVDLPTAGRKIQTAYPQVDLSVLNQHWHSGFETAIAEEIPMKLGAMKLLAMAVRPMSIVTSSGRVAAHQKLQKAQIDHHFQHVITVDDVTMAKPAPEPYLLAARMMGVDPTRCLVFEDSETGAEAAHRAGCIVVQIPDLAPSQGRWAHHVADDLLAGARHYGLI